MLIAVQLSKFFIPFHLVCCQSFQTFETRGRYICTLLLSLNFLHSRNDLPKLHVLVLGHDLLEAAVVVGHMNNELLEI